MRLRMLATTKGAEDGYTVREYLKGHEYNIGGTSRADDLVCVFLREGWAEDTARPTTAQPVPQGDAKKKGR